MKINTASIILGLVVSIGLNIYALRRIAEVEASTSTPSPEDVIKLQIEVAEVREHVKDLEEIAHSGGLTRSTEAVEPRDAIDELQVQIDALNHEVGVPTSNANTLDDRVSRLERSNMPLP